MTSEIITFLSDFIKVNGVSTAIVGGTFWFLVTKFWPWLTQWLKERAAYHEVQDNRESDQQSRLITTLTNFDSTIEDQTGVLKSISTQMSQTATYHSQLIAYLQRIEEKVDDMRDVRPRRNNNQQ